MCMSRRASLANSLLVTVFFAVAVLGVQSASAVTCPIPGTRPATADDAVVKNGQIKVGTCYNPNEVAIGQTSEEAKQYLFSIAKGLPGSAAPPTQERINKLNDTFAICAAQFFKSYSQRYGPVTISSAYRDGANGENERAGGAPGSNHTRAVAIDANPAGGGSSYETMWKYASDNPQFGVCFPFQDGRTGSIRDRPHMILGGIGGTEGALCAKQGVTKPCNGLAFLPQQATPGAPYTPSPTAALTNQVRQTLGMQPQPVGMPTTALAPAPAPVTASVPLPTQSQFCIPEYSCSGNTLMYKNSFCAVQAQRECPGGCQDGACIATTSTSITGGTSSTTSVQDTLTFLSTYTGATSTSIGTSTPLQLLLSLTQNQSSTTVQPSSTVPTSLYAPGSIANMQLIGAQQTFTSSDLNSNVGARSVQNQTSLFAILENMKQVLLRVLDYLRPFSPSRYGEGDGHA